MSDAVTLVAFAPAGGTALSFEPLRAALDATLPMAVLERPGRGARRGEPAQESLAALVADAHRQLAHVPGDWAFLGHSFGGVLALALARALPPGMARSRLRHVFTAGTRPPWRHTAGSVLHDLPDEQLVDFLVDLGGIPEELVAQRDLMALFLPAIRADLRAGELAEHAPPTALPCPLTCLCGADDILAPPEDIAAWAQIPALAPRIEVLPGTHFFVRDNAQACAEIILNALGGRL